MKPTNCRFLIAIAVIVLLASCSASKKMVVKDGSTKPIVPSVNTKAKVFTKPLNLNRVEFVKYAKTFLGTGYKYGSSNPKEGLNCSGFISLVFNHFNVKAPRVTRDFTNEGEEIVVKTAKAGDIILFTGSDNSTGIVGHMGIIITNNGTTQFIHSASGKNIGVIESKLTGYWLTHFVKVIRVLE